MNNQPMHDQSNREGTSTPAPQARLPYSPSPFDEQKHLHLKPQYQPIDTLFALLTVLLGFLLVKATPIAKNTLGACLCLISCYILGFVYLRLKGVSLRGRGSIYTAAMLILSLGMITGSNRTVRALLFIGLILAFFYWCYVAAGLDGGALFTKTPFLHLVHGTLELPFASGDHLVRALLAFRKKNEGTQRLLKAIGWALVGLLVAVIPTTVIILLLSYDLQFSNMIDRIFSFSFERVWENIWKLVLGFCLALILFGAMLGSLVRAKEIEEGLRSHDQQTPETHRLPLPLFCTAVTPILAVYCIFFLSQWDYYISAFTHRLPEGLTYSAYAREGFFQLCTVCALNALMLLLFHLLLRKKEGRDPIKVIYSIVISLFTLILIATAISKMALYISFYGLTQKRVYASWLMLLLAVVFLLAIIAQLNRRFRLFRAIALTCLVFVALIAIPNVDGMIASYNVDAYLSGKLDTVDVFSVDDYGASSVPALIKLEQAMSDKAPPSEEESLILAQARNALTRIEADLDRKPDGFFSFNIPESRARRLLEARKR